LSGSQIKATGFAGGYLLIIWLQIRLQERDDDLSHLIERA
jgi:hypothetical protein